VRFDLNDYSIPHTHVRRGLPVLASPDEVRILDGQPVWACHQRSYDKGAQIEDPAHIEALVGHKRAARRHRGTTSGPSPRRCCACSSRYGAAELQAAIEEALARGVAHPNAVRRALERRREHKQLPPVAVTLPEHVRDA
jgi:hypothetical protein